MFGSLKLTPRTSYCEPVKDRIIRLQQAAPPHSSKKEKRPPSQIKKNTPTPLPQRTQMGLIGNETQLMCTCIGVYRGGKKNMASRDEVESKRDEIRRRKRARQEAPSSSNADTQNTA